MKVNVRSIPELIESVVDLKDGIEQALHKLVIIVLELCPNDLLSVCLVFIHFSQFGSQSTNLQQHLLTCIR